MLGQAAPIAPVRRVCRSAVRERQDEKEVADVVRAYVPAWCERQSEPQVDGRYVVACYFTRDGHPVSKAHAERVELVEYAPDGTLLRIQEGVVDSLAGRVSGSSDQGATSPV